MTSTVKILRWIVRLVFLAALLLGLFLWSGYRYATYLRPHMWLGFIVTFALLLLVVLSLIARIRPVLPLVALLWAVALPVLGIAQLRILPGPNNWLVRVVHIVLGVGAVGLAEALSKRALGQGESQVRP